MGFLWTGFEVPHPQPLKEPLKSPLRLGLQSGKSFDVTENFKRIDVWTRLDPFMTNNVFNQTITDKIFGKREKVSKSSKTGQY